MQVSFNNQGITIPKIQEVNLAQEASRKLLAYMQVTTDPVFQLMRKGKGSELISLPVTALKLLIVILSHMAQGNAVTLMPVHAELTTQEAANLLNVSRPFLVELLEKKQIPFRRVGTKRRVLAKDVLSYKEEIDKKRLEVLAELANEAQIHNMGY